MKEPWRPGLDTSTPKLTLPRRSSACAALISTDKVRMIGLSVHVVWLQNATRLSGMSTTTLTSEALTPVPAPTLPGSPSMPLFGRPRLGRRSRRLAWWTLGIVLFLLSLLWFIGVFGGNIRTVLPGRLYRSAQLTGSTLQGALVSHHIRTVVNLRGPLTTDAWYKSETQVCKQLGVSHLDVSFSATSLPPPEEMQKLVKAFDNAHYPVMVHCMGGSDRAGLASTVYMAVYQHEPLDQAQREELTFRYGHIKWGRAGAMDRFLDLYRKTGRGLGLRDWIFKSYPAEYARVHH